MTLAVTEVAMTYTVRNTFIEIVREASSEEPRRSRSCPPQLQKLCRSANSADSKCNFEHFPEDFSTDAGTSDSAASDGSVAGEAPPSSPARKALSTRAKAWKPSKRSCELGLPVEVALSLSVVVAAARLVLEGCSSVSRVEVWKLHGRFKVHAHFAQEFSHLAQSALELAKTAMLEAAEQSSETYIVGYAATPFTQKSNGCGFEAQLALVSDETNACWDLLASGLCRRGCLCRWSHPAWQATVDVTAIFHGASA
mmetsp:Transcript_69275/g.150783  ORF Transcript_69275/g.150783 Transcript_69275/m.150783 type:complete len:254 (+) Transcript_69275:173-934(+)